MKKYLFGLALVGIVFSSVPKVSADDPGDIDSNKPAGQCRAFFANDGYLFDQFEQHQYVNGLLEMHFRLKEPYNDGRGWIYKVFLHRPDCTTTSYTTPTTLVEQVPPKMKLFSLRFSSESHYDLWNDEQDIKMDCFSCSGDLPAGDYSTFSYSGLRDGGATFFHSGSYPIKEADFLSLTPVLIVPGILGTELQLGGSNLWPNIANMVADQTSSFMDPLAINPQGQPVNSSVVTGAVLSNLNFVFGNYHYSDLLVQDLEKAGYHQNQNLFLLPYDWRLSVKELSKVLQDKVNKILVQTGAKKINLVGHSLGGLIIKQFLLDNGNSLVDKTIFVGTPNLGSAVAAKALLFGDDLGIPLLNTEEIHKISQNMPSIYDLLPSKEYFKSTAGYYDDLTKTNSKNILDYAGSKNFLLGLGKDSQLIGNSESLHQDSLDNQVFNNGQTFNIVGCGLPTLKTINKMYYGQDSLLKKVFNQPKYEIVTDNGDGTALVNSASHLAVPAQNTFYIPQANHEKLLVNDISRLLISSLLAGSALPNGLLHDSVSCPVQGKMLSLASSIELTVVDKKTGGKLLPNAGYTEAKIGNDKFVILPSGADYQLSTMPNPTAKPSVISIKNYNNQKTEYYDNADLSKKLVLNISTNPLESAADSVQAVDPEGSVQNLAPSKELTVPEDDLSVSETKLIYQGQDYVNGVLTLKSDDKKLSFLVTPGNSGTQSTNYSFDQGETWKEYQGSAFIVPSDAASISFFSIDHNGIAENPKVIIFGSTTSIVNTIPAIPSVIPTTNLPTDSTTSVTDESAVVPDQPSGDLSEDPVISEGTSEISSAESVDNPANSVPIQVDLKSTKPATINSLNPNYPPLQISVNFSAMPMMNSSQPSVATGSTWSAIWEAARFLTHLIFF
ncbi:MAG: hypothetical protein JWO40_476 [Candidatus Doudnabacteria bacterium]|nr:hypothetical protein [Candidatus Doudnabacteria bacterium]